MNDMDNTQHQDEVLRQLFGELAVEISPAEGFTARVMDRIMLEKQRAAARRRLRTLSAVCAAALLPVVVYSARSYLELYLWSYIKPLFISLSSIFSSVAELFSSNGSNFVLPGLLFLFLLVGDLFFRIFVARKTS
jgi:hypothetical protein